MVTLTVSCNYGSNAVFYVQGSTDPFCKCRSGVNVPGVRMVDVAAGALGIDWIEGKSVRRLLPGGTGDEGDIDEGEDEEEADADPTDALQEYDVSVGMF